MKTCINKAFVIIYYLKSQDFVVNFERIKLTNF